MSKGYLSCLLALSVVVGLSSSQFFQIWLSLELNMLVFLNMMYLSHTNMSSSTLIKYFFIQSSSSTMMFWGVIMASQSCSGWSWMILFLGTSLKMGVAPFHQWYLGVFVSLDWYTMFVLSVIQKILPLLLMWVFMGAEEKAVLASITMLSSMAAITHIRIKPILAYSSLMNMSWMLMVFPNPQWVEPYLIYVLIMMFLFLVVSMYNQSEIFEASLFTTLSSGFMFLGLFALSGLPPLVGFWMKVKVVLSMTMSGYLGLSLLFMLVSVAMLSAYYRLFVGSLYQVAAKTTMIKETNAIIFLPFSGLLLSSVWELML